MSVLDTIEALPPGIYGMEITERGDEYDVRFVEHRLEDAVAKLNREARSDERPFEAVKTVSEWNQRAYELFARPFVQAGMNENWAHLARTFHPLRFSRWALSDLNPWAWWLGPAAAAVKAQRAPLERHSPLREIEGKASDMVSASLDYWRDVRDAVGEAAFYQVYGQLFQLPAARRRWTDGRIARDAVITRVLERIGEGGYAEAVGRVAALLRTAGASVPLSAVEARHTFVMQNLELLPKIELADLRRIEGEQEIIVREARNRALETLPALVRDPPDAARLRLFIERAIAFRDERGEWLNDEQRALAGRIAQALAAPVPHVRPPRAV